jgi:sulfur carrier protein
MICVNQQEMEWEAGMTIRDILERRKYTFPMIVVKVNDEVVLRETYDTHKVPDEAEVQVIHLISGG